MASVSGGALAILLEPWGEERGGWVLEAVLPSSLLPRKDVGHFNLYCTDHSFLCIIFSHQSTSQV